MELIDFRTHMIEQVRAFDKWAWQDMRENADDWQPKTKQEWLDMFQEFIGD